MNIKTQLTGEQFLVNEILDVIPLIIKHFKPFDGMRAEISTGQSAKFNKMVKAFREECEGIVDECTQVYGQNYYSSFGIIVKFRHKDPSGNYWNYFEHSLHVGRLKDQNFYWDFKPDQYKDYCELIKGLTEDKIQKAQAKVKKLKKQIDEITDSFPYPFSKAVGND